MIYDNMETGSTHINTVLHHNLIHFKNLTADTANVMSYRFKLKNTNRIKLVSFFETKMFDQMRDGKLQSFDVDWGDGTSTKVFTENINTGTYNSNSNLYLTHDYDIPMNQEIEIVVMGEYESLCPMAFDEDIDGIEITGFGGVLDHVSGSIGILRPHLRKYLLEIYSLNESIGKTLLFNYSGNTLRICQNMEVLENITDDIFDNGCGNVTDIDGLFRNNRALRYFPSFRGFRNITSAMDMATHCVSITEVQDLFSHLPTVWLGRSFKGCVSLTYIDPANFRNKSGLGIADMFDGCTSYVNVLNDRLFEGSTFIMDDTGISGAFKNIPDLKMSKVIEDNPMQAFLPHYSYNEMFRESSKTETFEIDILKDINLRLGIDMFSLNEKVIDANYVDLPIQSIGLTGSHVNITRMFKNRSLNIPRVPFTFNNVSTIDYTDCFVGCRSLYNDKQIFGDYFVEGVSSGLEPITAKLTYMVDFKVQNPILKFGCSYNSHEGSSFKPEYSAEIKVLIDGSVVATFNEDYINTNWVGILDDNIIDIPITANVGVKEIVVEYHHCAPLTLTYKNTTDYNLYEIQTADLQLFPTDQPYMSCEGLELFTANNVSGDLFSLFYDRPNISQTWQDSSDWFTRIFKGISPKVVSVSRSIFDSISFLGRIRTLSRLFTTYIINTRDIYGNLEFYKAVNPFIPLPMNLFDRFVDVEYLDTWFNYPNSETDLVDISESDLSSFFSYFSSLKSINHVLAGCIYNAKKRYRINWPVTNLESIQCYIGKIDYLDLNLLTTSDRLSYVRRFHMFPMIAGADLNILNGYSIDFSNSVTDDVDISEMFFGEKFEIPNGFIKNVRGVLTFNYCFYGSYRFDIDNDSTIFENIGTMNPGDISAMEFVVITEPLILEVEGPSINIVDSDVYGVYKDKKQAEIRSVVRVYTTEVFEDPETSEYEMTKTLINTYHGIEDRVLFGNLNNINIDKVDIEIYCLDANVYISGVNGNTKGINIRKMSGAYGRTQWVDRVRIQDAYPGLVPSNIECTNMGGPWKNIEPTNGIINFTEMFTGITNKDLIDYRILKTNSPDKTTYNLTGTFRNGSIANFDIRMFEFIGDMLINGTSMFERNSDENFNFINLESGPYIFMEILFTKIVIATNMFKWSSIPKSIFNHAPFFGCDRNGEKLQNDKLVLTTLKAFVSKYQDSSGNSNNPTEEFLPRWNPDIEYKLTDLHDFLIECKYKINSEENSSILPNTSNIVRLWASYLLQHANFTFKTSINFFKSNDVGTMFSSSSSRYIFYLDKHLLSTTLPPESTLTMPSLFNSIKRSEDDINFKFLIEPFGDSFNEIHVSALEGSTNRPPFVCFKTYAPDNILFRNVKSFTGTSGAELLTYPNFIEYQNIHLTGNQISFIREELAEAHRFSTYLTVHIKYSDTYEEAKWFIVDKNADSYTIDLEESKIVNNTVSIKIQSTQCFYLMKTNVDYVEKLEGTYRKDLQPRDSEFFNFDVDYYYFIERFGADLWKDVKIKQGDSKFRFGISNENSNKLVSIDGSPFRTQNHVTNINYLFYKCKRFVPSNTILTGFGNVTTAYNLFNQALSITSIPNGVLDPLVSVTDLGHLFHHIKNISNIPVDLFHNKPNLLYINESFGYTSINSGVRLAKEFWNNISPSVIRYGNMFYECQGLSIVDGSRQFIANNSFTFNSNSITTGMFSGTNLLDVRISWIKEGSLVSANSIDMFKGCYTYEERSAFEARYGNQTGVNFKCYESCVYKSSSANLTGRFIHLYSEPTLDKNNEYVKVAVDSGVYFKTLAELENSGITVATSKVEVYSDYPIIFECTNVERLEGKFPTNNGSIFDLSNFNLGQKYPNLQYIDPLFFSKLTNVSDMSYVFRDLRDINIIPANLFTPLVNLRTLNGTYSNAKGTLNNLSDITNFVGPSTNINSMDSLFKNVTIKQIGRKAIKIRNTGAVNLSEMFDNTHAYIDNDTFEGTPSSINVAGMFNTCKSLYSMDELTTLTKTGDSLLEILKSFRPVIGLTNANSEINLMVLHDSPDNAKLVDVLVDWGDGNSNIMVGVRTDSITHVSKVIASSGDKTLRIWCSYYGVGVKLKTDSTGSIVKHAGGYVGKFINPAVDGFMKLHLPEATSIDSELLWDLDAAINAIPFIFRGSNILHLPQKILKRLNMPTLIGTRYFTLDGVTKLKTIGHIFNEAPDNFLDSANFYGMFYNTHNLEISDNDFISILSDINAMSYNPEVVNAMFYSTKINITQTKIHEVIIRINQGTEISLNRIFYNSSIEKLDLVMHEFTSMVIRSLSEAMRNSKISLNTSPIINIDILKENSTIPMNSMLRDAVVNGTNRLDHLIFDRTKENSILDVTHALTSLSSVYTESEIFGDNTLVGSSGLTTDPRTVMKMTVTAGTLNLLAFTNSDYTSKLLIKKNGIVESLNPYADKSLSVADNDIIEVITFNNIKDAYVTIDLATSTSKVKHLDGILNIGPKSIVDGKFNKTIAEAFGTDIISISDTFLTQFNTVTSTSGLCKGLINLTSIPKLMINHMTSVTNWASMFENCNSLVLTQPENSEMFINANKGVCYDYMFKNCTSITMVPEKFFKGCLELDKTFIGAFTNTRLTRLPDDIDEF